jgi:hypothetical protein
MSALIDDYLAGLHRRLPAALVEEAAAGLLETYEHHLSSGASDQDAARAALAEFGDLAMVAGEFTRQAPGRRAARLLLATGPVASSCWAVALILSRAWTVPATARLGFGAILLLAVLALLAAATSRHSYQRTRLAMLASPVILVLDMTAVAAVVLAAPALTLALRIAVGVSLVRIAFTARTLPRLAAR